MAFSGNRNFWEEFINLFINCICVCGMLNVKDIPINTREDACKELVTKCKEQFATADKEFVVKKIHAFRSRF
jgi:hypothetical protein